MRVAIVVGIGLTFLTTQPVFADAEWDKLGAEFDKAYEEWTEAIKKLATGGTIVADPSVIPPHPAEKFRARFRRYAEKHDGTPEAIPALAHLLLSGFSIMEGKDTSAEWALSRLKEIHAADPLLRDHLEGVGMAVDLVGEESVIEFLETVARTNHDRETKGAARLGIAEILLRQSPMAATTGAGDTVESQAKKKRAVKILRQITSEFAGTEIAEQAEGFLFDIDYLQVGMKAPEIIGADTDGREIRLSQFAGKVVAIVFWATWCQPCMQMIPHERELMEKHAGKPFTILGINLDNTSADCKETIKKEGISWPIIYDGTPDISKIVRKWHVQAFPTIFVIDHKGVIRHRQVIPFQLGKLVDDLIDKAIQGDG